MSGTNWIDDAAFIEVEAEVRYWEDASVNGKPEDNDAPTIFGAADGLWRVRIDLREGIVVDWPAGMQASIHYKVCDQGEYWLADDAGKRIAKWRGHYVPDDFLCHGSEGFGDYIIMDIEPGGGIAGYEQPEIDPRRWDALEPASEAEQIDRKDIPLQPETVRHSMPHQQCGPITLNLPEGEARCHDAVSLTVITASRQDDDSKFMMLITAADFDGQRLGCLNPMTPNEARSLAASLIQGANDIDGGASLNG